MFKKVFSTLMLMALVFGTFGYSKAASGCENGDLSGYIHNGDLWDN